MHSYTARRQKNAKHLCLWCDVVIVHDEHLPRGLWKLGRIQETIKGRDGQIRGATIRVARRDRQQDLLHRPIQLLYPLEVCSPSPETGTVGSEELSRNASLPEVEEKTAEHSHSGPQETRRRSQRAVAQEADERRKACMYQLQDS